MKKIIMKSLLVITVLALGLTACSLPFVGGNPTPGGSQTKLT